MQVSYGFAIEQADIPLINETMIYNRWKDKLVENFDVRSITVHNIFKFGARIGFMMVEAEAYHEGRRIPGLAFLRGDSVSIMPVFTVEGMEQKYTAVVTEPRCPIAKTNHTGLPAGMIDGDTFVSAAIKELAEEVGEEISIDADDLINLGKFPLSCGGCDEFMTLMAFEYNLTKEMFRKLDGRQRGCAGEHENIHVRIIPLDDVIKIDGVDARSALSYLLWKSKV